MGRTKAKPGRGAMDATIHYHRLAARLVPLSHPTGLRLLMMLDEGEPDVGDLAATLGCRQPGLSYHLAGLKRSGAVAARRAGTRNYYSLTDAGRELLRAVERLGRRGTGGAPPGR